MDRCHQPFDLLGYLLGTCWVLAGYFGADRSYTCSPKFRDSDNDFKYVAFYHLRIGTAVSLAVPHHLAHAGTEFVGAANLAEEGCDDRGFRERREGFQPVQLDLGAIQTCYVCILNRRADTQVRPYVTSP